jgi:hypothetical protein
MNLLIDALAFDLPTWFHQDWPWALARGVFALASGTALVTLFRRISAL